MVIGLLGGGAVLYDATHHGSRYCMIHDDTIGMTGKQVADYEAWWNSLADCSPGSGAYYKVNPNP